VQLTLRANSSFKRAYLSFDLFLLLKNDSSLSAFLPTKLPLLLSELQQLLQVEA